MNEYEYESSFVIKSNSKNKSLVSNAPESEACPTKRNLNPKAIKLNSSRRLGLVYTFDISGMLDKTYEEYQKCCSNFYLGCYLNSASKDKMTIDLRECFEILSMNKHCLKLEKAIDTYTKANCIHYCCILGHTELLQKILEIDSSLATSQDDSGNTPLHYLCQNTVSRSDDIVTMWRCLVSKGAKVKAKNSKQSSCIDVINQRIKAANPYDELAKYKNILKNLCNL